MASCREPPNFSHGEGCEAGTVSAAPFAAASAAMTARKACASMARVNVPHPAGVAADFVLVEAAFVLGSLEGFLDGPASPGDADQVLDGGAERCVRQVVGDLFGLAAACQCPPLVGGHLAVEVLDGGDLQGGPVVDARAFGAVAARVSLPGFAWCLREEMGKGV